MPPGDLEIVLEFARAEQTDDPFAFRFGSQAYLMPTPRGGGGYGRSELVWDSALLARLQAIRRPGRDPALVQEVGELLRRFLAPIGWETIERTIADAVRERRPVRLSVRSQAAELYTLPWELLTLRTSGQSLGGLPGVLIRYEWPQTESVRPDMSTGTGRTLVAWSAAGGPVPAAEHVAALQRAAAAGGVEFDPGRDVVAHASTGRLAAALAEAQRAGRPVALLHVLCHGAARGQVFGLHFHGEAADDEPVIVDPARLQQILAPYAGSLRLVLLAACDSGNGGEPGNRIGSVAQMLHRGGLAAVVASRFPLTVPGSTALVDALARALLSERSSLEQAFIAARVALAADAASLDWASLQLYARAADGGETRVFPPAPAAAAPVAGRPRRRPLALAAVAAVVVAIAVALRFVGPWEAPARAVTDAAERAAPAETTGAGTSGPAPPKSTSEPATGETTKAEEARVRRAIEAPLPEAEDATSAGPEAPPGPERKKRPAPVFTDCPSSLKSYVAAVLGRGDRLSPLIVTAGADGSLSLAASTPGDVAAAARPRLAAARPDRVRERGGASLPCRFKFDWGP